MKLGYTERLVQAALHKLGPDPGQNELLAELIRLGASCPKLADTSEEADGFPEAELSTEESGGNVNSSPEVFRPVVIDGSNVAMSHGNKEVFSCRGIKICVDWFRTRGHREITVFVPKWRKEASRPDNPIAEQDILGELERDRLLVFTPSRLDMLFCGFDLIRIVVLLIKKNLRDFYESFTTLKPYKDRNNSFQRFSLGVKLQGWSESIL